MRALLRSLSQLWARLGLPRRPRLALPAQSELEEIGRALSARLRLFDAERNEDGALRFHGREAGLRFHLSYTLPDPAWGRRAETLVDVHPEHPALPADFSVFLRAARSAADLAEAVPTGDRLFDRRWTVTGDRVAVHAALSPDTRALVARSGDVSVTGGWLYMRVEGLNLDVDAVEAQVRHALKVARTLAAGLSPPRPAAALLENMRLERNGYARLNQTRALFDHEPSEPNQTAALEIWLEQYPKEQRAPVRLRVLEFFLERAPSHEATTRLLEKGLLDASPEVRLVAARHLEAEGLEVMLKLATTRFASEGTRLEALSLLEARLPADRLRECLLLCARDDAQGVRRYALRRLLEAPYPGLAEALARAASSADREAACDLAELLTAVPAPLSEPALLALLASRSAPVRRAAVQALAQVGTVQAVPALLSLAKPIILDGSLRDLAHDAILRIQYRIQAGELGGLALIEAGDQAGGLSPPETEAGALSFGAEPPDQGP